jgi:hypothetical protein
MGQPAHQGDATERAILLASHLWFLRWFEVRFKDMQRADPEVRRGELLRVLLDLQARGLLDGAFEPVIP